MIDEDSQPDPLILIDDRPTRADAIKNRELLLRTARTLFDEKGPDCVSMSEIAQAAGVGKGTLYRHFSSKADISIALLDHEQRALQNATIAKLRDQSEDPMSCLRWFLLQVARFAYDNCALLYFGLEGGALSSLEISAHSWQRPTIIGLLEKLDLDGDIPFLGDVLYAMLDLNVIHFQKDTLGYDLNRISNGLLDTLARLTRS